MTWKKWSRALKRFLSPLPRSERQTIVAYYREMFEDKLDFGLTEQEILAEFGSAQACAGRMIAESSIEQENPIPASNPFVREYKVKPLKRPSVGVIVGMVFFTLLLVIPIVAVWISVIASFAAVGVACIAVALAGLVFPFLTPFYPMLGFTGVAFTANLGLFLASAGAGLMLSIVFFYATKYTAIGLKETLNFVYGRKKQ